MGPIEVDWDAFLRMRLNEHLVHEWDVAVALNPTATLPEDGTKIVVDNLELIARFTAKPHGDTRTITVATTAPERRFAITIGPQDVILAPTSTSGQPDLTMPSEAFVRLVYGRLDPPHTPDDITGDEAALDQLRAVFPGP